MRWKPRAYVVSLAAIFAVAMPAMSAESQKPSRTAIIVAIFRAIGARHPDVEFRNPDSMAEKFLGPQERALVADWPHADLIDADFETAVKTIRKRIGRFEAGVGYLTARTRRIDELLTKSVERGITQVVILGAGFDSRAYRLEKALKGCTVFELDLLPTQRYKRQRVQEIRGSVPANVVYVPIDFNKDTLTVVLDKAGYRREERSFFIWEGVACYLTAEAVDVTLRFVSSNAAAGSEIVFDYMVARAAEGRHEDEHLHRISRIVAEYGEPFTFGIRENGMAEYLSSRRLRVESDLGNEDLNQLYLTREDGTKIDSAQWWWRIGHASVGE